MSLPPPPAATVQRLERAGLPTLWIQAEGAVRASLVFRVGLLDETFPRGGITHLVEHLALTGLGGSAYEINGYVSTDHTVFMARGSADEATAFLTHVASALSDLPSDRLDVERGVLMAEAGSSPGINTVPYLAHLRWGVRGPGRRGLPELGLRTLDAADLRTWARERFTSHSATLCWVGPEPPPLELGLPDGPALPVPATPQPVIPLPFAVNGDDGVVALGATVPAGIASAILGEVLERRVTQVLRHERGLVYSVEGSLHGVDTTLAHLALLVEIDSPARAAEVQTVLIDQLEALAAGQVEAADLDASRRRLTEFVADQDWMAAHLVEMAVRELSGSAPRDIAQELAAAAATDQAAIAALAADALDSAVLVSPSGVSLPRGWSTPDDVPEPAPVEGDRFTTGGLRASRRQMLTIGEHGFSLATGNEPPSTALWDDIVAVTRERSGEYYFTNVEGSGWVLDPGSFKGDAEEVVRRIEARLDPATLVPAPGAEHFDAVDEAAKRDLKKPAKLSAPLGELPALLEPGEQIVQLASVLTKMRWGVLAVTDRRTLFVAESGEDLDVEEVRHAVLPRVRIEESLKGKSLVLETVPDPHSYWGFDRQREATELQAHLERLIDEN